MEVRGTLAKKIKKEGDYLSFHDRALELLMRGRKGDWLDDGITGGVKGGDGLYVTYVTRKDIDAAIIAVCGWHMKLL